MILSNNILSLNNDPENETHLQGFEMFQRDQDIENSSFKASAKFHDGRFKPLGSWPILDIDLVKRYCAAEFD